MFVHSYSLRQMASGQLPRSFKSKTRKNFWFFKTWKLSKCTFFNKTKEESNIYFGEFSSKLNEVFHLLLTVIQKKYEIVFVKIIVSLCQRPLLNIFFLFLCFLFFFLFFFSFFFETGFLPPNPLTRLAFSPSRLGTQKEMGRTIKAYRVTLAS